jgi:hypothetical protein
MRTPKPIDPRAKHQTHFLRAPSRPSFFPRVKNTGIEPRKSRPSAHHP